VAVSPSAGKCVCVFYNHNLWGGWKKREGGHKKAMKGAEAGPNRCLFYVTISIATATAFVFINVAITF